MTDLREENEEHDGVASDDVTVDDRESAVRDDQKLTGMNDHAHELHHIRSSHKPQFLVSFGCKKSSGHGSLPVLPATSPLARSSTLCGPHWHNV